MKTSLIAASVSLLIACSSPQTPETPIQPVVDPSVEVATQDTILRAQDAIPADAKAAAKAAADSWDASPGLSPQTCAGCEDSYGNSYAPGYSTCFGDVKVTCKGRNEKEPAGSGCFADAEWRKQEGACK